MLGAVGFFALIPLVIAIGGGDNPFLFSAAMRGGISIFCFAVLVAIYYPLPFQKETYLLMWKELRRKEVLYVLISYFDFAILSLSFRFANEQAAAVIFELWPIILILIVARNTGQRYLKVTKEVMLLLVIAFIGVILVLFSQSEAVTDVSNITSLFQGRELIGVILAVSAALVTALTGYSWVWSHNMTQKAGDVTVINPNVDISDNMKQRIEQNSPDMFFLIFLLFFTNTFAFILNSAVGIIYGVIFNEYITLSGLMIGVVGGIFSFGIASLLWRYATSLTSSLGIHAMSYGTPVFSVMFLSIAAAVASVDISPIVNLPYLIMGAIAIISVNLLINFEAEVRFGFKALILALWIFGTFVYLRDDLLNLLPFETWLWPGDTYPEALGLSATIFILLLSFRVARMSERTQDEDNRILELFQSLDLLVRRNVIDRAVRDHLIKLDDARTPAELQSSYNKTKLCFAEAVAAGPDARNLARLGAAETQLNIIVHSRQQGIELGELFALLIFGGSTILIGILSRPPLTGWIGFLVEILAVLFSAVIVFLIINVWDLHRERANLILKKREDSDDYGLIFSNPRSRRFEQSMSVIIGLAITVAYAALLWQKWLP